MRTIKQIQAALSKLPNVAAFARDNKLPARTVWRVMSEGNARKGTIALLDAALNRVSK
jgi:hypothetical protein